MIGGSAASSWSEYGPRKMKRQHSSRVSAPSPPWLNEIVSAL